MADFNDLLRQVRTDRSAALQLAETTRPRRPLPRTMRPPEARAADPRLADAERARAFAQMEQRRAANADTLQRQAQGRGQNQFAEAGAMALEPTGIPGALRGTAAIREGDYRTAAMEGGLALLNAATLGPVARTAAPRVPRPLPPSMRTVAQQYRSQVAPGSFDDIMRSRQPFMRPEADYEAAMTPPRWNEGRLFHGSSANIQGPLRPSRHPSLPEPTAVSLTPNPNIAAQFGDTIYPVQTRGMTVDGERFMARARELQGQGLSVEQASAQAQREFEGIGYRGIRWGDREVAMFNSDDIRPAIGRVDPEAAPRPTPPPREIGRASDGSVLPVAQARPFRRTAATSADLNEAARMQRGGLAVTQSPYAPRDAASPFAPRDLWQEGGAGRTGDAPMGPADTPLNFPRADEATRQLRALGRPFDLADLQDVQARVGLLSEEEMALLRSRVQSGQLQYAPPRASTPQPSRGGLALGQSPYAPRDAASPFAPRDAWQTNNRPDPHGEGVGADMSGGGSPGPNTRVTRVYHGTSADADFAVPGNPQRPDEMVSVSYDPTQFGYGNRTIPLDVRGRIATEAETAEIWRQLRKGQSIEQALRDRGFVGFDYNDGHGVHPVIVDRSALRNAITGEGYAGDATGNRPPPPGSEGVGADMRRPMFPGRRGGPRKVARMGAQRPLSPNLWTPTITERHVRDTARFMADNLPPMTPEEQAFQARLAAASPAEQERMWTELRRRAQPDYVPGGTLAPYRPPGSWTPQMRRVAEELQADPNISDEALAQIWDDQVRAGLMTDAEALNMARNYRERVSPPAQWRTPKRPRP